MSDGFSVSEEVRVGPLGFEWDSERNELFVIRYDGPEDEEGETAGMVEHFRKDQWESFVSLLPTDEEMSYV